MSEKRYTLKLAYFPIALSGGNRGKSRAVNLSTGYNHAFFLIYDNEGNLFREINGFATDKHGKKKAIGSPLDSSDRLKIHIFGKKGDLGPQKNERVIYDNLTEVELKALMATVYSLEDELDKRDLHYRLLSQNSNSVAATLMEAWGFKRSDLFRSDFSRNADGEGLPTKGSLPGAERVLLHNKKMADYAQRTQSLIKGFDAIERSLTSDSPTVRYNGVASGLKKISPHIRALDDDATKRYLQEANRRLGFGAIGESGSFGSQSTSGLVQQLDFNISQRRLGEPGGIDIPVPQRRPSERPRL
ncbi:hypothetical protein [Nitratireductor sp. XY-223]|uniref:hypothetical protein n=1 Tax=Nitratireductor sp. XY-223 TaxID=2561926 RepID=UPI0010AA3F68|nr:hypothetical protein [Nitratireductor sp. XY-223]